MSFLGSLFGAVSCGGYGYFYELAGQQSGPVMIFPEARAPERVGQARDRNPEGKVWKPP